MLQFLDTNQLVSILGLKHDLAQKVQVISEGLRDYASAEPMPLPYLSEYREGLSAEEVEELNVRLRSLSHEEVQGLPNPGRISDDVDDDYHL